MNAFLVQVKAVPLTDPDMKTEIASFIRYAQDLIDADLAIAAFQTASQQVQVRADQATAEINTTCTGSP